MKIISLRIEDFGCFSDRTFELSEGVNLIEGENESGKSTLISFIKFMLYGMPKKSSETAAFRARSISWKNNVASGSLTLSDGGKVYTVTRRGVLHATQKRESYSEEVSIIDAETGLEVHKGECPGEIFLGVPLSVFESTCFVRQLGSSAIDKDDVSRSLENMLVSADESLNLQKALDKLDGARKLYRHKNGKGGSIPELEATENSLKARLSRAMEDYNKILSKTDAIDELKVTLAEKRDELDRLEDVTKALGLVNIVKRFDLYNENKNELDGINATLKKYKSDCAASCGSIPSESHISALKEASSAQKTAQNLFDAAQENYQNSLNATQNFKDEIDAAFNENLRRVTDKKALTDKLSANISAIEKAKKVKRLGFISAVLLAIAAGVSFVFLMPLGIGLSVLTVGALALGIIKASAKNKLEATAKATLSDLGIKSNNLSDGLNALRFRLKEYSEALMRLSEHERATALSESARDMRRADLETCIAATDELMNEWSGGEPTPEAAVSRATEILSEISRLEGEVRKLSFSLSALASELSGYDEKDVRARVPISILEKFTVKDIERAENEKKFVSITLKQLSEKSISLERELISLEKETENPNRLARELEEVRERIEKESFTLDALILAQESLTLASSNIRSTITPIIRSSAGELMAALTGDKYSSVGIDESYNMFTESDGSLRSVSLLSAGTQDLAYLSLRMALLSVFYKDGLPPLALDDALTQLDDRRAKNALRLLLAYAQRDGQSILFTCHTREKQFLGEMGRVNVITL